MRRHCGEHPNLAGRVSAFSTCGTAEKRPRSRRSREAVRIRRARAVKFAEAAAVPLNAEAPFRSEEGASWVSPARGSARWSWRHKWDPKDAESRSLRVARGVAASAAAAGVDGDGVGADRKGALSAARAHREKAYDSWNICTDGVAQRWLRAQIWDHPPRPGGAGASGCATRPGQDRADLRGFRLEPPDVAPEDLRGLVNGVAPDFKMPGTLIGSRAGAINPMRAMKPNVTSSTNRNRVAGRGVICLGPDAP